MDVATTVGMAHGMTLIILTGSDMLSHYNYSQVILGNIS